MDKNSAILVRERVVDTIRKYFKGRGFHEVFTPILVPMPSTEPNLEVFETQLRTSTGKIRRAFLILSPEYSCKKLIANGSGNIFEITRCFRNEEEVSYSHNPEFTMLEWYRTNSNYTKIMDDFEQLFIRIIGNTKMFYQGQTYDLSRPWPRISFAKAFKDYAGLDIFKIKDDDFYKIYFNQIEPKLRESHKPVFLYDYPISQAALARPKPGDPRFAERFEVFLAGLELGNCFSELTDWVEQEKRLQKDIRKRKDQGKTNFPIDVEFIEALKRGLPPTAGIAVGVDRLVMLAGDFSDISQTLTFPARQMFELNR